MTKQPRGVAIITSDWHILERAWKHRHNLSGDAYLSLENVVGLSHEFEMPIIAAGDLFDSKQPCLDDLLTVYRTLADVRGAYIQGNHERCQMPWMKLVAPHWQHISQEKMSIDTLQDLYDLKAKPVEIEGVEYQEKSVWHFYGIDYVNGIEHMRDELQKLERSIAHADKENAGHVLVLHQSTPATLPMDIPEIEDGMIPDIFDLVIIGHCHEAKTFTMIGKNGRIIPAVSPGGIHLLSVTESAKKRAYILRSDGSLVYRPLITRRVINIDTVGRSMETIAAAFNSVLDNITSQNDSRRSEFIQEPIIRILVEAESSASVESLAKQTFKNKAHLFFKTAFTSSRDDDTVSGQVSRMENIDISRYTAEGYSYIAKQFRAKEEQDPVVCKIVEGLIGMDPDAEIYNNLKKDFCNAKN